MDMYLHENNIDIGNIAAEVLVYVLDALITVKTEIVLYIICIH